MSFITLIRREILWYWRSPSLWWSLPMLLLMVHFTPHLLWWSTQLSVKQTETLWGIMTFAWNFGGKRELQQNTLAMSAIGAYIPMVDAILKTPMEDLWKLYVVPALQAFSVLPLAMVIPPLAVTIFRRDTDGHLFGMYRLNGGHPYLFLLSKLIATALVCFSLQILALLSILYAYSLVDHRASFFEFFDPSWWLSCVGLGLVLALWTVISAWWSCLVSKNGCTEIYTSMILSGVFIGACATGVIQWGWSTETLQRLTYFSLALLPLGLVPLSLRMGRQYYGLEN